MEKIRVIIVPDKEKVGLRDMLKSEIERDNNLAVILLSRLEISSIRSEIAPQKPDMVFITASLYAKEEQLKELIGFIKKVKKHLPQAKIVIHSFPLSSQLEEIFRVGADAWVDDKLDYDLLSKILEAIMKNEPTFHALQVIRKL